MVHYMLRLPRALPHTAKVPLSDTPDGRVKAELMITLRSWRVAAAVQQSQIKSILRAAFMGFVDHQDVVVSELPHPAWASCSKMPSVAALMPMQTLVESLVKADSVTNFFAKRPFFFLRRCRRHARQAMRRGSIYTRLDQPAFDQMRGSWVGFARAGGVLR